MYSEQQVFEALMRTKLTAFIEKAYLTVDGGQKFVRNWHIDVLADKLVRCANGEITRLIINLPPRSLKSVCTSVAFPAWLLGHYPDKRVIAVSYAEDLANKHARDCRAVMESDWYKRAFPKCRINPHKRSEGEFETTRNGCRISTSIGGVLTGRGGSMIIIDDPLKPQDALSEVKRNNCNQWYDNTLFSRLDNKETGCIIIVMQRVHMDDLVDYVQRHEKWEICSLPAIALDDVEYTLLDGRKITRKQNEVLNPTLESLQTLNRIKASLGSYNFATQYQQEPIPPGGNIIKSEWFHLYDTLPSETPTRIYQSWDTAMTAHDGSDYSACVTIAQYKKQFFILDVYREKLDFPSLKRQVIALREKHNAHIVVIEDKGSGTSLMQQLKSEFCHGIAAYQPKGSKEDRICAQSAHIECGDVRFPRGAPWLEDFIAEAMAFPNGRHDDQLDAFSQGIHWALDRGVSILDVID